MTPDLFQKAKGRCVALLMSLMALTVAPLAMAQDATAIAPAPEAAASKPAPTVTLRVAVKPAKPFAFEEGGQWKGYSVDVWNSVAEKNNWRFEWVPTETVPQALSALQAGKVDVAVGALSVTEEREKVLDFSHPFYESGLQIVSGTTSAGTIFQAINGLMSTQVLGGLGVLLVSLILVSWLLWRLERSNNEENFPKPAGAGLKESLWWSTNILIAGGCENISPTGTPGRLVAVVWMLGGIAFTSYITAVFTSTLTVQRLGAEVHGLQDLQGQIVATLEGSSSDQYLAKKGVPVEGHDTLDAAMASLLDKNAKAVVYDAPMIRYWLNTHPKEAQKVTTAGDTFARQHYAFALPVGSDKRKAINEALLEIRSEGGLDEINKRWFGEGDGASSSGASATP
jgi:polar amino acid transport system substrate-binding protein